MKFLFLRKQEKQIQKSLPPAINSSSCNGMMRNMYQTTNRPYQYPTAAAMNNAMNGIGRYAAAQMSSMSTIAAVNSPYSSMAAQFSSLPNSNSVSNMNLRQVGFIFN